MRVLFDLNVLLDVLQQRQPHYQASAAALSKVVTGELAGVLPPHGVTTLHYLITRHSGTSRADGVIDWLLAHFDIGSVDRAICVSARSLKMADFEDAVVASVAQAAECAYIVTRNIADFGNSPTAAVSPDEFLEAIDFDG